MLNRLCPALFTIAALSSACTTDGGSEAGEAITPEEAAQVQEAVPDDKLLYDCKPAASAPHPVLQVYKVAVDAEADDPEEVDVVIETNNVDPGTQGVCARRAHEDDPQSVRYACVSGDERLRMYWPADAQAGKVPAEAQVEVRESWLFWTKNYTATCALKTL